MADEDNGGKGAQLFVVAGAASVVGGMLGALFASRPAKAAAETDKLEYIASLLETLNKSEADVLAAIKALGEISGGVTPGVIGVTVSTPWVAKEPVLIFQQAIRSAGTFTSDDLVDFRNGKRLAFKVESSLDQNVIIQLVANTTKTFNLATNLDGPFPCPANGNIHIGLAWDDWLSFVGVQITLGAAPISGMLSIWQVMQE